MFMERINSLFLKKITVIIHILTCHFLIPVVELQKFV